MGIQVISTSSSHGSRGSQGSNAANRDERQSSTADGNSLPPSADFGNAESEISPAAKQPFEDASKSSTQLQFRVSEATGSTVITVRNTESGTLVRQITTREKIAIAQYIEESTPTLKRGSLVDDSE